MKKFFLLLSIAFLAVSCTTTVKTAKTADPSVQLLSATIADLDVSPERISYTMIPTKELLRGGEDNVRQAAEHAALEKNGNADVLVGAEYIISKKSRFIFGKEINSITVTGHPAKYVNFRSANDSVWVNSTFRSHYKNNLRKGGDNILKGLFNR